MLIELIKQPFSIDLVEEFLTETGARPKTKHSLYRPPQTFRMDNIMQHMQGLQEDKEKEM